MRSKILLIILISVLFIFAGLYLSIKVAENPRLAHPPSPAPTNNLQPTTAASVSLAKTATAGRIKAQVLRVIDGDTIELTDKRRLRYIGINAPESVDPRRPVQCFGKEASYFNKQLVEGQTIDMEKDVSETDKYGRLLRYVFLDDVFINDFLVRQGYAQVETVPPDVKYAGQFLDAQREAREAKRGLWKTCLNSKL